MNVLGIYNGHNATAALLVEGRLVACVSEERFSGRKNHHGFPFQSIAYCLKAAGLAPAAVEAVAAGYQHGAPQHASAPVRGRWDVGLLAAAIRPATWLRRGWGAVEYRLPALRPIGRVCFRAAAETIGRYTIRRERAFTARHLGIPPSRITYLDHHLTHAVTAYYGSPYHGEEALVLTLDGEGDGLCAAVFEVRQGRFRRLAATPLDHSLGWIYLLTTRHLGMTPGEDEYKVMGLAPYAPARAVEQAYAKLQTIIRLDARNPLRFAARFDTHQTARYLCEQMASVRFDALAGAVQRLLEERLTEWVRAAVRATGLRTVVAGGGVFMNVKANLRIAELPEVERFFPFPTAGDESTPIGACYGVAAARARAQGQPLRVRPLEHLYLGPTFSEQEAEAAIRARGIAQRCRVSHVDDIEERVAELLAQRQIVARVQGPMEWGARALGNRSILAHPSDPDAVQTINQMIKGRDFWMPFAPTILAERADDYVINPKRIPAAFMALCFRATARACQELRAALHPYDGTLRPQLLTEAQNPSYYRILKAFERRTGLGGVLNTSYNLHGSPLVLGPIEALETFERSGLQYLALGPLLIEKQTARSSIHHEAPQAHAHAG